jgi:glycerol 2-dehydrogenase (NADP+)
MEKVLASGKVKAIGLSNFSIKTYVSLCGEGCSLNEFRRMEELFKTAKVMPAMLQVE